jgi:2-polyprenyl-3-methyl-5-hydroxy-6-metoxy-1,4-benzoquinol methylase
MCAYARDTFGVDMGQESAEFLAAAETAAFDAAVLDAVLEQVHGPAALIRTTSILLRPEGVVYLDLPNEPNC